MNKVKDSVILVTGGAGFIGSYVIEELLKLGPKEIRIVDNFIRGRETVAIRPVFVIDEIIELNSNE